MNPIERVLIAGLVLAGLALILLPVLVSLARLFGGVSW